MKTIKGSYVGNRKDTSEALDFFERGFIKAPFKTIGMSELQKVYDLMRKAPFPSGTNWQFTDFVPDEGKIAGRYVVDTSK